MAKSHEQDVELLDDDFSIFVEKLLDKYHIPGMSIAVVNNGSVSAKGFGISRFPNVQAKPETLYFTGSTTKAMLATATGVLMHGEADAANTPLQILQKNKWATTIKSLLPQDFQLEDQHVADNITIEDALSHRTGLSGADNMYGDWMGRNPKSIVQALRYIGPLNKLFRTAYQYNNLMYSVIGDCLARITGLECGTLLKKLLWTPLKMTSTFWTLDEVPETQRKDLARGYYWVENPGEASHGYYVPEPYIEFANIAPAGAVISSVNDYAKWIQELLAASNNLPNNSSEKHIVTSELFSQLTAPRTIVSESTIGDRNKQLAPRLYGLGWIVHPAAAGFDHPIISHAGGLAGFGAQLYLLPNDNFGCVTLANTALWSNVAGEIICLELIARKLGLEGDVKDRFIELLGPKLPPVPSETSPEKTDSESGSSTREPLSKSKSFEYTDQLLEKVIGTYQHPAWGSFQVSRYKPLKQEKQVIYMPWVSKADRKGRDKRRSEGDCLLVSPLGHRTWSYRLLLHPKLHADRETDGTRVETNSAQDSQGSAIFFDLEALGGHGNVNDDALEGLDSGCEDLAQDGLVRLERVWHSQSWSKDGAAIVTGSSNSTAASTVKQPYNLGMRLATELISTDGDTKEGWKEKMTWFTQS